MFFTFGKSECMSQLDWDPNDTGNIFLFFSLTCLTTKHIHKYMVQSQPFVT